MSEINLKLDLLQKVQVHYIELGEMKTSFGEVAYDYNNGFYDIKLEDGSFKQFQEKDIYPVSAMRKTVIEDTPSEDRDDDEDEVVSVDERVFTASEVMELIKKALEV